MHNAFVIINRTARKNVTKLKTSAS